MHTLASLLPQEENTPGVLPSTAALVTCETHLKHTASRQSCPDLLSERSQPMGEGQKPLLPAERVFRVGSQVSAPRGVVRLWTRVLGHTRTTQTPWPKGR